MIWRCQEQMDMGEMWKLDFGKRAGFPIDIFPLHHGITIGSIAGEIVSQSGGIF